MDHAVRHKPVGQRLWIAMSFGAGLTGALMMDLPASHAANMRSSESWTAHEAAASVEQGIESASLDSQEARSSGRDARSSLSGESVRWGASSFCLDGTLREVINQVAAIFGPVRVNSTCRSRKRNARVGGARRSRHLTGDAADFNVNRNDKPAVLAFLQNNASVGGLKLYSGSKGHFHIDTGPRRTW